MLEARFQHCVCVGVHSVNADMLHSELIVYYSKFVQAPAVDTLQHCVNDFATIFIYVCMKL